MTEKCVTIPENELAELIHDRTELATMLSNLIVMWKHEEKLKQHHRPYLYVRKETERLCDLYLQNLAEINERIQYGVHPCKEQMKIDDVPHSTDETDGDFEPQEVTSQSTSLLRMATEDLSSILEYVFVLRRFVKLLESGVGLCDVTEKFNVILDKEIEDIEFHVRAIYKDHLNEHF